MTEREQSRSVGFLFFMCSFFTELYNFLTILVDDAQKDHFFNRNLKILGQFYCLRDRRDIDTVFIAIDRWIRNVYLFT